MLGGGWGALTRDLDWEPTYVRERSVFPEDVAGSPWLAGTEWSDWEEPYKTTFGEYVRTQSDKEKAVRAVHEALGGVRTLRNLDRAWISVLKLHGAALALGEYAAVVGNLRAARFGRSSAWRTMAALGALDEVRHTQIPLALNAGLVRFDAQFDFTHRLYHTNGWLSIAGRHLLDDLLIASNAIEFAIATNFVFETGFTNLQFIGLAAVADGANDHLFRTMLSTIQSDEARHAQIGRPTFEKIVARDPALAQAMVDKWFWRTWLLFSAVTGITMDYLTPLAHRGPSFKEFVEEWVVGQFLSALESLGLARPWYWDLFERSASNYHHMVYASAYSYRATVWFDLVVPGPAERGWLRSHYPESWQPFEPVWERVSELWRSTDPGVEFAVHGAAIPTFCSLCQMVLCHGCPQQNDACDRVVGGQRYVFCSEPCRWIFEREPDRYVVCQDLVRRVLAGKAPGNLIEFLTQFSGLRYELWGKDARAGDYPWLYRERGGAP